MKDTSAEGEKIAIEGGVVTVVALEIETVSEIGHQPIAPIATCPLGSEIQRRSPVIQNFL